MYQFLSYRNSLPYKEEIESFLERIRSEVSYREFDFSYNFTCGSSNNMIVYDDNAESPHFDVDIVPHDPNNEYSPYDIRDVLFQAFWNYYRKDYTIKKYPTDIELTFSDNYTCSFYIVRNLKEGNAHRQQYIKYVAEDSTCYWTYRKLKYGDVNKKTRWLKERNLWNKYKLFYIEKIIENNGTENTLKDTFLESLYQMCRLNGYEQRDNVKEEPKKKTRYDFEYIDPAISGPVRKNIEKLIKQVQKNISSEYTFQYQFIGSSARNMITADKKGNVGFDFDVNIIPQKIKGKDNPEHLRTVFFKAIQDVYKNYGFNSKVENSTSVITIKNVDHNSSKCLYGCDFAVVRTKKGRQQNIVLQKKNNKQSYVWEDRGDYYNGLSERVEFLKKNSKYWNELRRYYLEKKNTNYCEEKKSRAIYAESVKEICDKYGYHK